MEANYIKKSMLWIKDKQNNDGGWGEDCATYWKEKQNMPSIKSMPSQTAWSILSLLTTENLNDPCLEKGINFLKKSFDKKKLWEDHHFNAVGFPKVFYITYHGYAKYFPNWALYEGRFIGQVQLQLGGPDSPTRIPAGVDGPMSVIGGVIPPPGEAEEDGLDLTVRVLNLTGADVATAAYEDVDRPEGNATVLESRGRMISDGSLALTGPDYGDPVELLYVGEKLYIRVIDPDHDVSDDRDMVEVKIDTRLGEKEKILLEETFSHSGAFTGSFRLDAVEKPVPDNLGNNATAIETFFGDLLTATFVDEISNVEEGALESTAELAVSIGANGIISSFSKVFADEELAVRTQFHIAESYFELFKSHQKLGRDREAANDLENGRRTLKHLVEDYPDPKYAPRVNYLLGQFSQELKQWSDAIDAYDIEPASIPDLFAQRPVVVFGKYRGRPSGRIVVTGTAGNGRFKKSIIPVKDQMGAVILDHDEHMRPDTTMQSLASLNPSFVGMGGMGFDEVIKQRYPELESIDHVHHAGNSSGIVDGASAVLFGSKEAGEKLGLKPRARIRSMASIGSEPGIMLTGPSYVTEKALKKAGMEVGDIDIYELNEAFAAVVLRMMQALDIPHDKMNVNGGAIAMGHPLGATGGMILGTMVDELERADKETALITLCVGAGMGTATIIERV